ncbi:hypothetical protein [Streptomyces sp. NRRL S-350]|uniref:hypothetical protein n=1 Tax=Streptomyces sp. NRRL S-350 TaxID=1463902 RepID=UPI0004C0895F|nr:hypothetical protein [Streptomyces sp. NRRL S-350]
MPQPARLIWANNRHNPEGVTLYGTGYSDPIDLTEVGTVFLSTVVGDPPRELNHDGPRLTVSLQVQDAGATWLPVAELTPYGTSAEPPSGYAEAASYGHVFVGLFLPDRSASSHAVPLVLPPTARIRWDAYL